MAINISHLPPVLERLVTEINDAITDVEDSILNGSIKTLEEYKEKCGKREAYGTVLSIIEDITSPKEK